MIKKVVLTLAVTTLGMFANTAMAEQQGPWLVRARALNMSPANKSEPIGGAGPSDRISVSNKTFPEFDISYFFTPNIALEVVLTYPQKHDVYLDGNKIGTFKHLPPTFMGQYHFIPDGKFDPYLGLGVNYTRISSVDLADGALGIDRSSVGPAIQAGVDFKIDKTWSINFDVKKVQIRSDVTSNGVKISNVKVDPVLVSLGVGYRF